MTHKEAVKKFGKLERWRKGRGKIMSWTSPIDTIGVHLFSFDGGKTVHSVFGGGKNELTEEQLEIFRKENSTMARLYISNKE